MKQEKFKQKLLDLQHTNYAVNNSSISPFIFAEKFIFYRRLVDNTSKANLLYSIVSNLINTEYLARKLTEVDLSKDKLVNKINTIS